VTSREAGRDAGPRCDRGTLRSSDVAPPPCWWRRWRWRRGLRR